MGVREVIADVGPVIDIIGAGVYVLLGLWVATLRPRSTATVTFAIFSVSMGSYYILSNAFEAGLLNFGRAGPFNVEHVLLNIAALGAFLVAGTLASFFPVKPRSREVRVVVAASLVALAVLLLMVLATVFTGAGPRAAPRLDLGLQAGWLDDLLGRSDVLLAASYWVLLLAWTWRYPLLNDRTEVRWRRQVQTVVIALSLFFGLRMGLELGHLVFDRGEFGAMPWPVFLQRFFAVAGPSVIIGLVVAAKWLSNARDVKGWDRRRCLLIAFMLPGLALGMQVAFAYWVWLAPNSGAMGLVRLAGVIMIVTSLLHYRLFDMELRVKFAVRSSTLAALFTGVFFLVAEILETVFGIDSALGSVVAAAAIAVALRPLQRVASRVATTVLPGVSAGDDQYMEQRRWAAYTDAMRGAQRDGVITDREERELAQLVAQLDLDPEVVVRLRNRLARA